MHHHHAVEPVNGSMWYLRRAGTEFACSPLSLGGFWVHQIPKAALQYELFDWMSHRLLADSDLVMVRW